MPHGEETELMFVRSKGLGPLGGLDTAASIGGPSGADMHSKESLLSGGSGGQDVSSWHHLMRKLQLDSMPWKKSRHNMSSDSHALTEKIIDHGGVMIIDRGNVKANVSSDEYDEEKSYEDTSKMTPSVNTQKLDANQLAAKNLHLRMKGKHEEADQLSRKIEAVLEDGDEPRHEKGRISIRLVYLMPEYICITYY